MTQGCQYIGPDQTQPPYRMCGCTALWPGRSYCEEHVWKVYSKGTGVGVSRKNKAIEKKMKRLQAEDAD